jgi:hypothetical protein
VADVSGAWQRRIVQARPTVDGNWQIQLGGVRRSIRADEFEGRFERAD